MTTEITTVRYVTYRDKICVQAIVRTSKGKKYTLEIDSNTQVGSIPTDKEKKRLTKELRNEYFNLKHKIGAM